MFILALTCTIRLKPTTDSLLLMVGAAAENWLGRGQKDLAEIKAPSGMRTPSPFLHLVSSYGFVPDNDAYTNVQLFASFKIHSAITE
jgi:hypothetical protein